MIFSNQSHQSKKAATLSPGVEPVDGSFSVWGVSDCDSVKGQRFLTKQPVAQKFLILPGMLCFPKISLTLCSLDHFVVSPFAAAGLVKRTVRMKTVINSEHHPVSILLRNAPFSFCSKTGSSMTVQKTDSEVQHCFDTV